MLCQLCELLDLPHAITNAKDINASRPPSWPIKIYTIQLNYILPTFTTVSYLPHGHSSTFTEGFAPTLCFLRHHDPATTLLSLQGSLNDLPSLKIISFPFFPESDIPLTLTFSSIVWNLLWFG